MLTSQTHSQNPPLAFKGIAVFTPGGDLVYCRDYQKRAQWHLNLCGALQEQLGLLESPHFLVPVFTATVDCWHNAATSTLHIAAEAYPFVYQYQGLLNALFDLGNLEWTRLRPSPEQIDLSVLATHRSRFPQLWENHDLVLDLSETSPPCAIAWNAPCARDRNHRNGIEAICVGSLGDDRTNFDHVARRVGKLSLSALHLADGRCF